MAWEWLEKLDEVTGEPGYSIATSQSWDNILSKVGTGWSPVSYANGQCLEGDTSSNYYYDSAIEGLTKVITTTYGLTISYTGTPSPTSGFTFDTGIYQLSFGIGGLMNSATFRIAIDRDNELATIIVIREFQNGGYYTEVNDIIYYNRSTHYNKFYKWVIDHSPKKATVKVNYTLPSDQNYTYAKIVYKKDTRPDNEEDGTAVTILKDETSVNISKLDVGFNYWFTIFTDKNQSESFPYTVEELPYPPEYQTYIDKMNKPLNIDNVSSFNDGFWFANLENQYRDSDGTSFYTIYPFTSVSWFVWANSDQMITPGSFITLDISGDDTNGYSCSVSFNLQTWVKMNMGDTVYYTNEHRTLENYKQYHVFKGNSYSGSLNFSEQYSNSTLTGLFNILSQNYRNVNIKVNGVYWSKVK